jgi:hypothetical protein
MDKQEWVDEIAKEDPRVKFVRLDDEMIGHHQDNGRLSVLMVYSRGDNRGKYYYCQCDCGKKVGVWGNHFRKGHTKSCGCWHDESSRIQITKLNSSGKGYQGHDLTGQTYFDFKVLEKVDKNNNSEWIYRCICPKCEKECFKTEKSMRETISCGCFRGSQGENKIQDILEKNNIQFVREKTFSTCKDKGSLRFDFYVNNSYLIEFDGEQHFKDRNIFDTPIEDYRRRDEIKNQWCKENNIPLIRIPYTHLKKICLEDLLLETSQFIIRF